ncbi:type II secretion system F family protein [Candidatus Micrarchaeota archaeon]|nr:type II secretion system F family protein [Candidatus Micrarchaeota archaeon]
MRIPLALLPPKALESISRQMVGVGALLCKMFLSLKMDLFQAGFDFAPKNYCAAAFASAALNAIVFFSLVELVGFAAKSQMHELAAIAAVAVGGFSFLSALMYPKMIARKRVRALDTNLIPAMRQMLIELRSGVTLFQAMQSVTKDYGEVSVEFARIVERIDMGVAEMVALGEASKRNPSPNFRRVLWQVSNAVVAGSDVTNELEAIVNDLTKEKMDDIRRYGQELNPWTMAYMMCTGVIPSLGLSIAIILLSFMSVGFPKIILPMTIVGIVLFNVFFMNFIKNRRPVID